MSEEEENLYKQMSLKWMWTKTQTISMALQSTRSFDMEFQDVRNSVSGKDEQLLWLLLEIEAYSYRILAVFEDFRAANTLLANLT